MTIGVALLTESVDRNRVGGGIGIPGGGSLSSRRAWIEMLIDGGCTCYAEVALLTESVDRNFTYLYYSTTFCSRSPHGERG